MFGYNPFIHTHAHARTQTHTRTRFPAAHARHLVVGAVGVAPAGAPTVGDGVGDGAVLSPTHDVVEQEVGRREPEVGQVPRPPVTTQVPTAQQLAL